MALSWKKDYLRYKELYLKLLIVYKKRNDVRMFLEIILSLITITFFSIFALKPTLLTVSQLIKDNKEKQETINKMEQKIKNIVTAQNVYDQNFEKIFLIEQAVPNTPTPENLLRQIEGISYKNFVTIVGSSINEVVLIGEEKKKTNKNEIENLPENVSTITFSINVTGPYLSLYSFLFDLENSRRPLIINNININSSKKEDDSIVVMSISGQTPYIKK
ncbi:MAG: GspMb/PilO family protein [Patescibacteria group bacterium]